jgi:hypothetical protein
MLGTCSHERWAFLQAFTPPPCPPKPCPLQIRPPIKLRLYFTIEAILHHAQTILSTSLIIIHRGPKKLSLLEDNFIIRKYQKYKHAETHRPLAKPLYFPNMKYLKRLAV